MKLLRLLMCLLVGSFAMSTASGQANAFINILTQNSGQVALGGTVFIQVDIGNTGPGSSIGVNKVRAQISVPSAIVSVVASGSQTGLPPGWIITANTGSAITVCNGSDVIAVGTQRTILIAVHGDALGGPSTVAGVLSFGPGTGVCTGPGSLAGDNTADNTSTSSITVISAPACGLSVSAAAGTIACNGGTTTLTATPAGASGAVEYSLNGGAFQAGNTFTVNATGSPYTVTAREVATPACNATSNVVTVTEPTVISASAASGTIACNGGTTTLTVTASGGTGTLEYSLNGGAYQAGNTFTVGAGSHTVTVRDANSCTVNSNTVVVTEPTAISASAAAGTIACNGGTTTLTVTASGGSGSLEYSLNGGAFQAGNTFTVGAGSHTVTVRDGNSCTANTNSVVVSEPTALVAGSSAPPIALPGQSTTVTVSASGGTAPYTGTGTFTRTAGSYTFTVTDANGCSSNTSITLSDPTPGPANALINVLTLNSGTVAVGQTVDVQISVGNTGPGFIGVNKVRAQVSVPIAIATALPNVDQTGLPPGWIITNNNGSSITVCNGTDNIPAGEQRQVMIKVQGTAVGGPSTIAGVLSFGPGSGVCTGPGSLAGDNTADNTSTSSITVTATLPVSLTDFYAKLVNCQPALQWVTEVEVDFDRFEIERSLVTGSWTTIGTVMASGTNTTTKLNYGFTDRDLNTTSEKVSYRLKMIDKDGHYKYSRVLLVYINCNTIQARVYPNPTEEGRLYVSLTGVDKNAEGSLLSLSGQVLLKTKLSAGTNSINVSGIADGTYILDVSDAKGFNKKFKVFIHN